MALYFDPQFFIVVGSLIKPPAYFITFCKIADRSTEQAQEKWLGVWKETNKKLISWVIYDLSLNEEKILQLDKFFEKAIEEKSKLPILKIISPVLDKNQAQMAEKKLAELFINCLENVFDTIRRTATVDQLQVLTEYTNSKYVRTT